MSIQSELRPARGGVVKSSIAPRRSALASPPPPPPPLYTKAHEASKLGQLRLENSQGVCRLARRMYSQYAGDASAHGAPLEDRVFFRRGNRGVVTIAGIHRFLLL